MTDRRDRIAEAIYLDANPLAGHGDWTTDDSEAKAFYYRQADAVMAALEDQSEPPLGDKEKWRDLAVVVANVRNEGRPGIIPDDYRAAHAVMDYALTHGFAIDPTTLVVTKEMAVAVFNVLTREADIYKALDAAFAMVKGGGT